MMVLVAVLPACNMNIEPSNLQTTGNLLATSEGAQYATDGNYSALKDVLDFQGQNDPRNFYERHLYQMTAFPSDNLMLSGSTTDNLYYCFTRAHFPQMKNSSYFWFVAYKVILGTNLVIDNTPEGESTTRDQLIGENYFLRAMAQFDLLRLFAQPYSHGTDNPGIILKTSLDDPAIQSRATVGESYQQVEKDLLKAADLMNESRGIAYASKEAAWAFLSRLYLYMEQNDKAIEYAQKVIDSGKFSLATNANYIDNFHNTQNSSESIFIFKNVVLDDKAFAMIGSMYLTAEGLGWGEVYPSKTFRDLLNQHPEDVRNGLIVPDYEDDGKTIKLRNGYPKYFITKFSYQDDIVTLNSPQYLRLSEVILNRAEANAKLGKDQAALDDVNMIRQRAGLSGTALYTTGNLGGRSVLDIVLEERRLELAYEGHRMYDLFRNKRDMDRSYPGVHLPEGETTQVIPWDDPRNIYYIPVLELNINPDCKQNP